MAAIHLGRGPCAFSHQRHRRLREQSAGAHEKREIHMKPMIKASLVALALAGVPVVASVPAAAAVDFSLSLGNAAFGYSDGYWDRDHHWHNWRNKAEASYFRDH